MRTSVTACFLLSFACLLFAASQVPQTPEPLQTPPTLRITVTLVQVDAVVTDSSGRHVTDLKPEDFEILQDGEVQKIAHFAYVAAPAPVATGKPDPKSKGMPIGPPKPITAAEVLRTVALVVDDMALSFPNLVRVRDALRKYIEQQMQPGDLVGIVRTGGGIAILEQFTTDKRILLEAVDSLKWRFSGRAGVLPVERLPDGQPQGSGRSRPQSLDYDSSVASLGALSTLEQVVEGMRTRPGRKSIVYFSDALQVDAGINAALDHLTDLANRSAVSIYPVDPSGLKVREAELASGTAVYTPDPGSVMGFPAIFGGEDEFTMQQGLQALASRTGGVFYKHDNDLPGSIRKAADDQLGYYLLGYSPQEGTFEQTAGKPKFHRVEVRVLRPGLKVRWKGGFNGISDESLVTTSNAPKTREEQLMDALTSPFAATGLKVRLTSLFAQNKKDGPFIHSMLQFDAKNLAFQRDDQGGWKADVEILTLVYRGFKQKFFQGYKKQEIRLADADYVKAQKEGFLIVLDQKLKEPGTFLMRAVVRDRVSERVGSASQYVQVPDTRKGQLALSGILMRTAVSDKEDSPKTGAAWAEGGPAIRRYRPGLSVAYGYEVINPKLKAGQNAISAEVSLYRDGQFFYSGKLDHSAMPSSADPSRYQGGGILHLGDKLIAGEYLMKVVITDPWAPKKHSQAAQWIDFEVVPAAAAGTVPGSNPPEN